MDYNPEKINLLKKAPRVIMPLAARMGSAPNGRGRMKMKLKLNSSREALKKVPQAYAMYAESSKTPGPGDYYLPAAFGKLQAHNKLLSASV